MAPQKWFGVRCHFRHPQLKATRGSWVYEERILVVRALDEDQAIAKAEKDAKGYATNGTVYLRLAECFEMYSEKLRDGAEIFSLMRVSRLTPVKYLDRHFVTGKERARK